MEAVIVFDVVQALMRKLPEVFLGVEVVYSFGEGRPVIGDWSTSGNEGLLINRDGVGSKSGVYFFYAESGEIIYIGKAAKYNLHYRVWDHVGTPKRLENGWFEFPDGKLIKGKSDESYVSQVKNGRIRLGIVEISNPDLVPLVEVYLQTEYKLRNGRLPIFNKRIG
jgi:hypothetical protein